MASFLPKAATEREFLMELVKVAERSGLILNRYIRKTPSGYTLTDIEAMIVAMKNYGVELEPWAQKTAEKVIRKVERQNAAAWKSAAGITLTANAIADVGAALLREQVDLITSLPRHMAERVQKAALAAMQSGRRASDLSKAIESATSVEKWRARLIARTEIAKANATLTRARAEAVGVTHYIWKTVGDSHVRWAHEIMDDEICTFGEPPYIEGEGYHHPGEFPNCRCWAEPIFTEKSAKNESR